MKKLICLAIFTLTTSIAPTTKQKQYRQTHLYFLDDSDLRLQRLQEQELDPIFCIIVGTGIDQELDSVYTAFAASLKIPAHFFKRDGISFPNAPTKPICLQFKWNDKTEGIVNLQHTAQDFISNITRLRRDYPKTAPCVVITVGRGGLLVNNATQSSTFPKVDAIIELGTPIPSTTPSTAVSQPKKLYPNPAKCSQFFNIQTNAPYIFQNPQLYSAADDQKTYPVLKNFNPYNTTLIVNGKQISFQKDVFSSPVKTVCPLIGRQLFLICQKLSTHYSNYRTTWTALGTKQKAPLLMGALKIESVTKRPNKTELARTGVNLQAYQRIYDSLEKGLAVSERQRLTTTYKTAKANPRRRLKQLAGQTT